MSLKQQVLATMKSRDTEGLFELYVTRTPGYLWALAFRRLGVHPITVTLASMVLGAVGGMLFYSSDLWVNVVGILLIVWANWFDCADGQLARMTNKKTLVGRILDGFAGDVWFFFIYLAIALRLTPDYGVWIWLLVLWAGFWCHARQCELADYYRNAHLYFIGAAAELGRSSEITRQYNSLGWKKGEWFEKLYLFFYASYVRSQEKAAPRLRMLLDNVGNNLQDISVNGLSADYRRESIRLMPMCRILTFDARVGVLFLSLLVGQPWIYPFAEITLFEALGIYMNYKHESFCSVLNLKYFNKQ